MTDRFIVLRGLAAVKATGEAGLTPTAFTGSAPGPLVVVPRIQLLPRAAR